jgi:hypothetical protein
MLNILRPFGTFYGHLVILWQFDIFSPVLVYKKNLATLFLTKLLPKITLTLMDTRVTKIGRVLAH